MVRLGETGANFGNW